MSLKFYALGISLGAISCCTHTGILPRTQPLLEVALSHIKRAGDFPRENYHLNLGSESILFTVSTPVAPHLAFLILL